MTSFIEPQQELEAKLSLG